jgi:hypothetical protein
MCDWRCDVELRQMPGGSKLQQHRHRRWIVAALLAIPLLAAACGGTADEAAKPPAVAEAVKGGFTRITLSSEAAKRLDIQTAPVRSDGSRSARTIIPYGAVLYDPDGATWTYTSPAHLVFVRHDITVDRIVGKLAFLTKAPPLGTRVVTVGATELWGVEYGGIEED